MYSSSCRLAWHDEIEIILSTPVWMIVKWKVILQPLYHNDETYWAYNNACPIIVSAFTLVQGVRVELFTVLLHRMEMLYHVMPSMRLWQ